MLPLKKKHVLNNLITNNFYKYFECFQSMERIFNVSH